MVHSRLLFVGLLAGAIAASPDSTRAAGTALTLYSAQHQQMVEMVTATFTRQTGVTVKARYGEAPEIARKGASSPADVYFTENPPELMLLDGKELLAPIGAAALAQVPAKYSAPDGKWIGVFACENVLAYKVDDPGVRSARLADGPGRAGLEGQGGLCPQRMPTSLPLVAAVSTLRDEAARVAWLKGLKANGQVFDDDEGVVAAVDRGAVTTGIINSYYLERQRA